MKNDTIDNLFINDNFIFASLAELIEEEIKRIASKNLASIEDLNNFVETDFKKAILAKDPVILSKLHATLKEIIFPIDFKKTADANVNKEELPINNQVYKIEDGNVEVCCPNCETDEKCCEINKEAELYSDLEKIANIAGLNGKHEVAYIIEKFIQYNK